MGYLQQVTSGLVPQKELIVVLGGPGVGKTTFATSFPKSIIEDIEGGSNHIKVSRMPKANSYKEVMAHLNELLTSNHTYESFVFDSLDHFEPIVNAAACEENGWKSIDEGAFGKGYAAALAKWQEFMAVIKQLNAKMNIILVAHSIVKTINDPMKLQPYDRHEIKLQTKAAALIKEHVDAILFCAFEVLLKENKSGKAKALDTDGVRVMYTQSRPSHEAKNRFKLPYKIPLSYEDYKEAKANVNDENPEALAKLILDTVSPLKDTDLKDRVTKSVAGAKNDLQKLQNIYNKLQVVLANAG